MKKTLLLASAAALFATTANAQDFTGSLFLPSQGKFLSDTSMEYSRTRYKHNLGAAEGVYGNQAVTYGVTNNFSAFGAIGNHFNWANWTNQQYNNWHNFDYEVGGKYNMTSPCGKIVGQVAATYYTFDPKSWYGRRNTDDRWYKELRGEIQAGYKVDNTLTPYAKFSTHGNIDNAQRSLWYSTFLGAHKSFNRAAVDAGVRYDFVTHGPNTNQWYLQGEANYFVTPKVALGTFGDYRLAGSGSSYIKYDYTVGVNVKAYF